VVLRRAGKSLGDEPLVQGHGDIPRRTLHVTRGGRARLVGCNDLLAGRYRLAEPDSMSIRSADAELP
jgi:hypothetical protein